MYSYVARQLLKRDSEMNGTTALEEMERLINKDTDRVNTKK